MKKENKPKLFWYPFIILFVIFIALYIALESGYYETKVSNKVALTEEKIKEFESDVQSGVAIDVKDYLEDEFIDYSSKMSDVGVKVSENVENFMTKGINKIFDFLGSLI